MKHHSYILTLFSLYLALGGINGQRAHAAGGPRLIAPYVNKIPFANFITRQSDRLMDGDQEFRFIGANMPGLMLPYDWTLYLPERLHLPTRWEQEDGIKTLAQMNLRVVRLWNLPIRDPKEKITPGTRRGTMCKARANSTRIRSSAWTASSLWLTSTACA